MRTNIVLNDDLIREAMRHSKAKTKKGLIEEALQTFVRVQAEATRRETYRDRVSALAQRLSGVRLREAPRDVLRRDRESR